MTFDAAVVVVPTNEKQNFDIQIQHFDEISKL